MRVDHLRRPSRHSSCEVPVISRGRAEEDTLNTCVRYRT
jgi:hypothetical protein